MIIAKVKVLTKISFIVLMTYTQPAQANDFTGRELLAWSENGQRSYVSTSIVMANFIAGQVNPSLSSCIERWYFDDPRGVAVREREILSVIGKLPDSHPSGTILALVQRACGKFN